MQYFLRCSRITNDIITGIRTGLLQECDDVDIHTVTPAQLQQQMSYIEQNVFLFNTTIRENR